MRIVGTNGNDSGPFLSLYGTNSADAIYGLAGEDSLFGHSGNDLLEGGTGKDWIHGGNGIDTVSYAYMEVVPSGVRVSLDIGYAKTGNGSDRDTLASIENVWGSNAGDLIEGNSVANDLSGLGGNDDLYGLGGNDTLWGSYGDDNLEGGTGADTLFGGSGIDQAIYISSAVGVNVSLLSHKGSGGEAEGDVLNGIENLFGSHFADRLTGDDGDNRLNGYEGADVLSGGGGNDFLRGRYDKDTLTGGSGSDTFYFDHDGLPGRVNADVITDFSSVQGDKIDVTHADGGLYDHDDTSSFIGNAEFTGGHQVRFSAGLDATFVEVSGADQTQVTTIRLDGHHQLHANDFIL